jgi:nitrogenase molybdenum-cofactor synthesis protein NifE
MQKRLGIPYIELTRLYQLDKIKNQYALFAAALGSKFDDEVYFKEAFAAKEAFKKKYPHVVFAIGEGCNANAFELAFALICYGFEVAEVFGNLSKEDFVYIEKMAKVSPKTKIYSNLEPTMIYYEPGENPVDIVIGKDASYYHPEAAKLEWSDDIQPFGYRGVKHFFEECERVLELERGQI